jgi:hypothetical protein
MTPVPIFGVKTGGSQKENWYQSFHISLAVGIANPDDRRWAMLASKA